MMAPYSNVDLNKEFYLGRFTHFSRSVVDILSNYSQCGAGLLVDVVNVGDPLEV